MNIPKKKLIIFVIFQLLLHFNCANSKTVRSSDAELFKTSSILYGLIAISMNNETDLTGKCISDLNEIRDGLIARQTWAMKSK
jgi:hypothetical protein